VASTLSAALPDAVCPFTLIAAMMFAVACTVTALVFTGNVTDSVPPAIITVGLGRTTAWGLSTVSITVSPVAGAADDRFTVTSADWPPCTSGGETTTVTFGGGGGFPPEADPPPPGVLGSPEQATFTTQSTAANAATRN